MTATAIEKVVSDHQKDYRYKTSASEPVEREGAQAFVLIEQIDERHGGQFPDPQFRWSVWLMKPGEESFQRVHEDHAYESQRSLYLRLQVEEGKLVAFDDRGEIVWQYS